MRLDSFCHWAELWRLVNGMAWRAGFMLLSVIDAVVVTWCGERVRGSRSPRRRRSANVDLLRTRCRGALSGGVV
jgi:hypothetical protein